MRPTTQTFIDLIRTVHRDNAPDVLAQIRTLAAEEREPVRRGALCRHLETLAFRLEGDERLGAAAETYDLIAALVPGPRARWTRAPPRRACATCASAAGSPRPRLTSRACAPTPRRPC